MKINKSEIVQYFGTIDTFQWNTLAENLVPRRSYHLLGKSGESLYLTIDHAYVEINDPKYGSPYILSASLDGGMLSWNLTTKRDYSDEISSYHPDMPKSTASKFYDAAYSYILAHNPGGIQAIVGWWISGVNLDTYNLNIKNGMNTRLAAINTWSGRKAYQRGYVDPVIYQEKPNIIFHFKKPR